MAWTVELAESVLEDLRCLGRRTSRMLLAELMQRLSADPLARTRNMKTLRPNPIAQRELRLFGKYRALFNFDRPQKRVVVLVVGEKRGNALFVRGRKYEAHK